MQPQPDLMLLRLDFAYLILYFLLLALHLPPLCDIHDYRILRRCSLFAKVGEEVRQVGTAEREVGELGVERGNKVGGCGFGRWARERFDG